MNYPYTASFDPNAFSLWLDDPAFSEENTTVWTQAAGYAQPGFTGDDYSFDVLDATAAWGQSAALPVATNGLPLDTDWTFSGTVPDGLGHGVSLADPAATDSMAFAPDLALPFPTDGLDAFTQDFFSNQFNFSDLLSSTPSLTDGSSLPSPQSDGPPGDGFIPPPSWFMGDGNLAGQVPYHGPSLDLVGMNGDMSYPIATQSDCTRTYNYITAPTEALTGTVTGEAIPGPSSLGKRNRTSEEDGSGPQKRARQRATRVPGGTQSTKRTRRSPATRTRKDINNKSKAAGRGVERLASTTAQGVYHRSLPGLSVSQGSVGALELGQPSWIEEREVEVEMWQDAGSSAPQQIVLQSAENAENEDLHEIPGNLSARQRLMLQMSQADEERGAVSVIKCKLCPTAEFGKWETYKRHCKSCEKHPGQLKFCTTCGDYFGRPDSGIRHCKDKKHKEACLNTSPEDANHKKEMVERLLLEFEARLGHCLRNGEEIGLGFSDIVNKTLTNTSKKVSKQQEIRS